MNINIIVYLLILLAYHIYSKENSSANRVRFIVFCSLVLLLKTSLRSVSIGSDTHVYSAWFHEVSACSFSEMLNMFYLQYILGEVLADGAELGYQLMTKIISLLVDDFNAFTFIIQGLLFFYPIAKLVNKYSNNMVQILLAYVLMNALFMSLPMSNARQIYAIGLSIFAFLFLLEDKYWKALLCVVIGVTFHKSILLIAAPFALNFMPSILLKKVAIVFSIVMVPISFLFSGAVITFMGDFIGSDKYAAYGGSEAAGGASIYITLSLLMALFCLITLWEDFVRDGGKLRMLFWMILLTIVFCPLIHNNGSMIRITMYYQIYFLVIFPMAIEKYVSQSQIYYTAIIATLIVMSVAQGGDYVFFWQEDQNPYLYFIQ